MLLSTGWRPHCESKLEPLGITAGAHDSTISKLPLTRAEGTELGHRRLAPRDRSSQYAELFRANDIDGELLGRLTNDDLKDIGVASFGHRKKAEISRRIFALLRTSYKAFQVPSLKSK
jgi:hypothetical protein